MMVIEEIVRTCGETGFVDAAVGSGFGGSGGTEE
jgi:hypothetical protein